MPEPKLVEIVAVDDIPTEVGFLPTGSAANVYTYNLCLLMEEICRKHDGCGLSAVQVGIDWQLFIVAEGDSFRYFANCQYEPVSEERVALIEGCLSLSGRLFRTKRWKEVRVTGQELILKNGELTIVEYDETTNAIVFQHEIDHHNGILISEIGQEVVWRKY